MLLPLGASAVMLGLGFLIAFDTAPLDFRAAPWIVPVAQALVAIPFVVRIVAPTLRSIDPRQREAAALLGASPGRVGARSTCRSSRAASRSRPASRSRSRSASSARRCSSRAPTGRRCPVAIFRFLGRPGELNVAQAYALAVVLMAVTVVSVLARRAGRASRAAGWF